MTIRKRLKALDLSLPAPRKPAFSYQAVVVDQGLAWVAGQLPWQGDSMDLIHTGSLGAAVDLDGGMACARSCVLNGLSVLEDALGDLSHVERIIKLVGFVASAPGFSEQPAVIDAASGLLIDVFGESGRHARSAVGVAELPRGAPVEIELIVRCN